jgi:ABC-2 type transport system permease protein
MNRTYTALELRRVFRDYVSMFFIAVLPAFFYLIFGAAQAAGDEDAGKGNVTMYVMISMAAYGAVTATTGVGGTAAVERMQGWGRQLGLTPLPDSGYVLMKAVVAVTVSAIPITSIYLLGFLTGARGPLGAWLLSGLVVLAGAAVFALYGLAVGLAVRSEAALAAASGSLVILAFMGNIFFPLSGTLLTLAKFTPLYGYVSLARYPLTEGHLFNAAEGTVTHESLWVPVANVVVWAGILALLSVRLVRRGRARQ